MGRSHKHVDILDDDDLEMQSADFDDTDMQLNPDDELSVLQREIELERSLQQQQNSRAKSLPNDWQDFEPSDWGDNDI